jgi:hypothetical protein
MQATCCNLRRTHESLCSTPAAAAVPGNRGRQVVICRIHKTLRITPAMAAGVTDRLGTIADIVKVLEDWESRS